jgi:hypothetical protein
MSTGPDKEQDKIRVTHLSTLLRSLAGIKPSKELRDKLVATIPSMTVGQDVARRWPRAVSWLGVGVAAAIVLVAAIWLQPPTRLSSPSVVDINDRSPSATMADANAPHPQDSNIYDNNAL